ncbi:hypothetical protein PGT21_020324 [Puccinia graminis f. sp. tritici]|uniref:Uncharacterized protein n=1 Tax=Puccinia graminis f. sp. tritici TaxID=56615 RepID=A0A5B0QNM9_PUCGR|nr:hypothetical protein PGT21_020324 [Puccinia graminis f. sp. tritici]
MATTKKFSHPMLSRTLADIFEQLKHNIAPGSTYGQLFYSTSVAFTDPDTQQEKNILFKLAGYGSAITALIENHVYLVLGRLIPRKTKSTPVLHYGSTLIRSLTLAMSKQEVSKTKGGANNEILHVVLKHTNYDPLVKTQVQFKAMYHIGNRKNLANTFGLFKLGREILISGNIVGYNEEQHMWIINASNFCLCYLWTPVKYDPKPEPTDIQTEALAIRNPVSDLSGGPEQLTSQLYPTQDKKEDNYYATVTSTSGKKRTQKAILADEKRAKKALPSTRAT